MILSCTFSTAKRFAFALPLVLGPLCAVHAQLQVTDANTQPYTPATLIRDVFLGEGVKVLNVTFNGVPTSIGFFEGGQNIIGIERGIVLTTGTAEGSNSVYGPADLGRNQASNNNRSTAGCPDLAKLTTNALKNVATYEITFVPTSDTLRFRYCFASEEYPEYGCSDYNDVFGFFINGPGFAGPTNIALIPGTSLPVAINNLHPANPTKAGCLPLNEDLFVNNENMAQQPVYDGFTKVFTAIAVVKPCSTYTIKLALADVEDELWDSAVFLEAKSFGTNTLKAEVITPSPNGIIAEGCDSAILRLSLPSPSTKAFSVDIRTFGSATLGVDVQNIPSVVAIPIGADTVDIPIKAILDNRSEPLEQLYFDIQVNPCNRDTVFVCIADNVLKRPQIRDSLYCYDANTPLRLDGTVNAQIPPDPSFSNPQDVSLTFPFLTYTSRINVSGVKANLLGPNVLKSVCLDIEHGYTADLDVFLVAPNGKRIALTTDNGGSGDNYTQTCFTPDATRNITAGSAPFTGSFLPEEPFSDLYGSEVNGVWELKLVDDAPGVNGALRNWSISFKSGYTVSYKWTPTASVPCDTCRIISVLPNSPTLYTIQAKDSYGCRVRDSALIDVKVPLPATTVACVDTGLTSVTFGWPNVPGATGHEISVNNGPWQPAPANGQFTVDNLSPSTPVNLRVRGIGGPPQCLPLVANRTCVNCAEISASINVSMVSCTGGADGSIRITPTNINPPYRFKLGIIANTTGIFNGLKAGTYNYSIIDGSGCERVFSQEVKEPAQLKTDPIKQDVSCFGKNDGTIKLNVSGGTGNKTFTWSPTKPASDSLSALAPGTYAVTVRDTKGCTTTTAITITQPAELKTNLSPIHVKCFDQATGVLNLTATGGNPPYGYEWDNGDTTAILEDVKAGTYTVTIRDARGCTTTATGTINQPLALASAPTSTPVKCFGDANGTASVSVTGGLAPYILLWDSGKTGPSIGSLAAGTYAVSITDFNGCLLVQSVTVQSPAAINAAPTSTNVSCFGGNNGTATVAPTGGISPYTYQWSNNQTGQTASDLVAGNYTVTVRDQNSCQYTATASIAQPTALRATLNTTPARCFGLANGALNADLKGGTPPYTYAWSNGATVNTPSGLLAGNYTVTVRDANACTAEFRQSVTQPEQIALVAAVDSVKCYGEASGAIRATASGGVPGFSLAWVGPNGNNLTGANLSNLTAGDYQVVVTDANGCTRNFNERVFQPDSLAVFLPAVSDTVCFAGSNGTAQALPKGGTLPYRYLWDNNQTSGTARGLAANIYHVTVTDIHGCTETATTLVRQKDEMLALVKFENPRCRNGIDGTAAVSQAFYGLNEINKFNGFTYAWSTSPAQTTREAVGLKANGTYTVTIYDADGCSAERSVRLGNPDTLVARIVNKGDAHCFGEASGWAAVNGIGGGGAPFKYYWEGAGLSGQTDSLARGFPAGVHGASVTDARGCIATTTVTIAEPDQILLRAEHKDVACFEGNDGTAQITARGGRAPYQYAWANGQTTRAISGLKAGIYVVVVKDANECPVTDSVAVGQPTTPLSGDIKVKDVSCYGGTNGNVELKGIGGVPPYHYRLDEERWNGSPLQIGLGAGEYLPQVMDQNGCIFALRRITVQQPPPVKVDLGEDITIALGQDTSLAALISDAVAPLSLRWADDGTEWLSCMDCETPDVIQLYFTRPFALEVKDARGCIGRDEVVVQVEKDNLIFVPTGFSPNDDGNNDLLWVHGHQSIQILEFRVYDRWGELVYEATDFRPNDTRTGWDGTFRGQLLDPAVFVWTMNIQFLDGTKETLKGHTNLVR